ncbi:MAG: DUF1444 family protein [Planctomycetaceae bacterium]
MTGNMRHWQTFAAENGWFRVPFPPGWLVEETDQQVRLVAPDGGAVLVLSCFWKKDCARVDLQRMLDPQSVFVQARNVRPLPPLRMEAQSIGLRGEASPVKRRPWWRRIFAWNAPREEWRPWRAWAIARGDVGILAVYTSTGPRDPERENVAVMILQALEFADDPADPPERFADRVLALARRRFPLEDTELTDDFQLRLGESRLNLGNFYRSFVKAPERFEQIVLPALTTLVRAQELGPTQLDPPFADVADRIMPILSTETARHEALTGFLSEPWVGGLTTMYVVDEAEAYWYIREELRERWGVSVEELHRRALENLESYFERTPMEFTLAGDDDGPRILVPNRPDVYNAARILSEPFHRKLREVLGGEFAVGLPNRDTFVAFSLNSSEVVGRLRSQIAADFARMDHPLSDRLLLVSADGVSEFVAD